MVMEKLGSWAFIIGLLLAVIMGLFATTGETTIWILAFLGLVVGLLNVTGKESQLFLIASIAFMASASGLAVVLPFVGEALRNIVIFVAPAAAVVAFRAFYDIGKNA